MDFRKQIEALTQNQDEKMLLIRVCDKLERARERELPAYTAFLSPREQVLVKQLLPWCCFFGGTENTERKIAYYLPEYLTEDYLLEDGPITCLRGKFYDKNALTHRDVLGALMGAGLRRDAVGDIFVCETFCDFFILSDLKRYLQDNLSSAGRQHLSIEELPLSRVLIPRKELKEMRLTVASVRLDAVLSGAFHISRGDAAEAIAAGRAERNHLTCLKADKSVNEGDVLSLRGYGKLEILTLGGETRKGRTVVTVGIYQ